MTIHVEFTAELPDTDATDEQIDQWLAFELGAAWYSPKNPLSSVEFVAKEGSIRWRR